MKKYTISHSVIAYLFNGEAADNLTQAQMDAIDNWCIEEGIDHEDEVFGWQENDDTSLHECPILGILDTTADFYVH